MSLHYFKMVVLTLLIGVIPVAAFATPLPAPTTVAGDQAELVIPRVYVNPSYTNLARSMWAFNALALEDESAVDEFLRISECEMYTRFFSNEFEWKKIREATKDYLKLHKNSFPDRYEYVQPLLMDRYDFSLKGFRLMPESVFVSSSRLEVAKGLQYGEQCTQDGSYGSIINYPSAMMVVLKQPFALSFIRLQEDLAREYLKMLDEQSIDVTKGRPAYLRLRIKLDRYIKNENAANERYAVFGGELETVEVFSDRNLMFKIYEQVLN